MRSHDLKKQALLPPSLTMAIGNLVNLGKTSEMSPIKDEFLATYSMIYDETCNASMHQRFAIR